jgi:hypothetical protein
MKPGKDEVRPTTDRQKLSSIGTCAVLGVTYYVTFIVTFYCADGLFFILDDTMASRSRSSSSSRT